MHLHCFHCQNFLRENWSLESFCEVSFSQICPLSQVYHTTLHGNSCHIWAVTPSYYLNMLDKLQKWLCRTVGTTLAASLEPLGNHQSVACLILFYSYYSDRYSSELDELVLLTHSCGRSTCYSNRLHGFSITAPRCYGHACIC